MEPLEILPWSALAASVKMDGREFKTSMEALNGQDKLNMTGNTKSVPKVRSLSCNYSG